MSNITKISCITWGDNMAKKQKRGLFQSIFGKRPTNAGSNLPAYRLLSSWDSSFTPFSGNAWDISTVRSAVDAWARNAAKIQPRHIRRAGGRREDVGDNMELGVDQGLIQKLSDGSEESAQILAAIVEGGEEKVGELNEQLARVEEGKENFSNTVAEMETDFSNKMTDLETRIAQTVDELDVSIEAGAAGAATIQGYIDGAESMRSQLVAKYRSLAAAANAAFSATLEIHSPSKVFERDGVNTIQGDIVGAESQRENLERTYESLALAAAGAYEKALPSSTEEPSAAAAQRAQTDALVAAISGKEKGGGDTYVSITSPEPLDEKTAAREFKKAQRDLSLGVT